MTTEMRYLLEPFIDSLGNEQQAWGILNWILGTKDTPGVSYPLSPWMAYPFAGYIIDVAARHYRGFIETHRLQIVSVTDRVLPSYFINFLGGEYDFKFDVSS